MATRKKDLVRDAILHRLITARYRYGERVAVREIAAETGASRQPIMAALGSLAADGFVRIVAQVGCEVVAPTPRDVGDFFAMFARQEALMAELAAARGTRDQVAQLALANARIAAIDPRQDDAGEEYRRRNREFHALIHLMAGSPILAARQGTLFAMADFLIGQSVGFVPHMIAATAEHDGVVTALDQRDAAAAGRAMAAHIEAVGREVLG